MNLNTVRCGCGAIIQLPNLKTRSYGARCPNCVARAAQSVPGAVYMQAREAIKSVDRPVEKTVAWNNAFGTDPVDRAVGVSPWAKSLWDPNKARNILKEVVAAGLVPHVEGALRRVSVVQTSVIAGADYDRSADLYGIEVGSPSVDSASFKRCAFGGRILSVDGALVRRCTNLSDQSTNLNLLVGGEVEYEPETGRVRSLKPRRSATSMETFEAHGARRSGRTTRAVEEAIQLLQSGKNVVFMVSNQTMFHYVKKIVDEKLETNCYPWHFGVPSATSNTRGTLFQLSLRIWDGVSYETDVVKYENKRAETVFDHAVLEGMQRLRDQGHSGDYRSVKQRQDVAAGKARGGPISALQEALNNCVNLRNQFRKAADYEKPGIGECLKEAIKEYKQLFIRTPGANTGEQAAHAEFWE